MPFPKPVMATSELAMAIMTLYNRGDIYDFDDRA